MTWTDWQLWFKIMVKNGLNMTGTDWQLWFKYYG